MKAGDKVKHKLTGEILIIKKSYDGICSCYSATLTPSYNIIGEIAATAICDCENLELL